MEVNGNDHGLYRVFLCAKPKPVRVAARQGKATERSEEDNSITSATSVPHEIIAGTSTKSGTPQRAKEEGEVNFFALPFLA